MTVSQRESPVGTDIRTWPLPPPDAVREKFRKAYKARCDALNAVVGGSSFRAAAQLYGVDERTVRRDAEIAPKIAADGKPHGFRACFPYRVRAPKASASRVAPTPAKGRPHAFTHLLQVADKARGLVEAYRGALPNGRTKCPAFDRHHRAFLSAVVEAIGKDGYPFNAQDRGRRALLKFHKRLRTMRRDAGASEIDAVEPDIKRFNQLFNLAPLDRLEFDAHKMDVDWEIQIPRADGHIVHRRIRCLNLLALICAVSRYLVAYVLVLGDYCQLDVLRLFHRALQPWKPRPLIVPGMVYAEGARLGLPVDDQGAGPRGIVLAGDNALAHHADIALGNLLEHHRGIVNLGHAHVPEGRPIIEAFNRRLEQGALRNLAGGFQPQTRSNGKKSSTSYLRADDHPLHWVGLADLMDVIASGHNVTPHSGLNNRTPISVLDTHLVSGLPWETTQASTDAMQLTTVRTVGIVRGHQADGRHPYVQYKGARYRSQRLMGRWDLLGRRFRSEVNIEDLRYLVLLDSDTGCPWSRLTALPPWDRSVHDLHLREQIIRARNRGLLEINGAQDAIEAYHAFTREHALSGATPPDLFARISSQSPRQNAPTSGRPPQVVRPRSGFTSFSNSKD